MFITNIIHTEIEKNATLMDENPRQRHYTDSLDMYAIKTESFFSAVKNKLMCLLDISSCWITTWCLQLTFELHWSQLVNGETLFKICCTWTGLSICKLFTKILKVPLTSCLFKCNCYVMMVIKYFLIQAFISFLYGQITPWFGLALLISVTK